MPNFHYCERERPFLAIKYIREKILEYSENDASILGPSDGTKNA